MSSTLSQMVARRAYFSASIEELLSASTEEVLGSLTRDSEFSVEPTQRDAWIQQLAVLREALPGFKGRGRAYFEFVVPRLGKRIDVVLVIDHVLFVVEFKVGEKNFTRGGLEQVWDYALDLKNFHETSHAVAVAPVLVATRARGKLGAIATTQHDDGVLCPITVSPECLALCIGQVLLFCTGDKIDLLEWEQGRYPIRLTRDLGTAKQWLKAQARGSERYGMVVSSQAQRLKPHAIDVRSPMDPVHWFLDDRDDVRSSYYLEDVATEFHVQGLELDWSCVVWDGDFRYGEDGWLTYSFVGSQWQHIRKEERKSYLKNAYRVLLTRARQGMVIVVPYGDVDDHTRAPSLYDGTFNYLKSVGVKVL